MKVERRDATQEKRILAAMITDPAVLGRIATHWQKGLFRSKWSNLIGGWCVKFFERYEKAPGQQIESRFEQWAETNQDEATTKLVEQFLSGLSGDYESTQSHSSEYIIDLAAVHFNRVRKLRLIEQVQVDLDNGDDTKADERFNQYSRIELGIGAGVDVLQDKAAIKAAFEDTLENLIVYPDALGNFFHGNLTRDALVAALGPEKRGKSFWLLDMAWRAMEQKRRVAYFDAGDNSQNQVLRRFMVRASRRPWKPTGDHPVQYPIELECDGKKRRAAVEYKSRHFKKSLDFKTAWKACRQITGDLGDESFLKISCHPNGTLGVQKIASILESWERHSNWIPDVIICDYADLLVSVNSRLETRDQINETWKALRGLSQERHCLVVTATQADATSYDLETLTMKNFSNDKRKNAHVTAMFALNQTGAEKRSGLQRLTWIVARDLAYDSSIPCHVAGCFAIANPAVRSIF